jgi:pimeloyl-ACP methyl ester carboxylesterase
MQPHTRTLEANGIQTAYEICGHGPSLVLIHGVETDRKSFASVLPELSKNFSCVTYDQRDTGETRNPPVDYTAADLADDAASLINALGGKAHVWGSSFGGMVAQELASLRIAKEIRGSTLTYLNGVGHAIAIETPQRVTRIIREFHSTHE